VKLKKSTKIWQCVKFWVTIFVNSTYPERAVAFKNNVEFYNKTKMSPVMATEMSTLSRGIGLYYRMALSQQ